MFASDCTAVKLTSDAGKPYWFRTCDIGGNIWEEGTHLVSFPRGEALGLSGGTELKLEHALLGVTYGPLDTWLMDGVNDAGLVGGLLALYEGTSVPTARSGYLGVVGMELVTWMLGSCACAADVAGAAERLQVLDVPMEGGTASAHSHYMFMDRTGKCVILEAADPARPGLLTVYEDNLGVMTNSPPYPAQLDNLRWFLAHSPELNWKREKVCSLTLNGMTVTADGGADHCCMGGIFPASYASYDRFVRMAVLSSLNDEGRGFSDDRMLALGSGLMCPVIEPHSKGVFHYAAFDGEKGPVGSRPSYTQYLVMYDPTERAVYIRPHGVSVWTKLALGNCSAEKTWRHQVCQCPLGGVVERKSESG